MVAAAGAVVVVSTAKCDLLCLPSSHNRALPLPALHQVSSVVPVDVQPLPREALSSCGRASGQGCLHRGTQLPAHPEAVEVIHDCHPDQAGPEAGFG